jgi:hypothetical protein
VPVSPATRDILEIANNGRSIATLDDISARATDVVGDSPRLVVNFSRVPARER